MLRVSARCTAASAERFSSDFAQMASNNGALDIVMTAGESAPHSEHSSPFTAARQRRQKVLPQGINVTGACAT